MAIAPFPAPAPVEQVGEETPNLRDVARQRGFLAAAGQALNPMPMLRSIGRAYQRADPMGTAGMAMPLRWHYADPDALMHGLALQAKQPSLWQAIQRHPETVTLRAATADPGRNYFAPIARGGGLINLGQAQLASLPHEALHALDWIRQRLTAGAPLTRLAAGQRYIRNVLVPKAYPEGHYATELLAAAPLTMRNTLAGAEARRLMSDPAFLAAHRVILARLLRY